MALETTAAARLDVAAVRADFPILAQEVNGHPLSYLDSAASSQKPEAVIRALDEYYRRDNANVHRGIYALSERATAAYEGARHKVARFIGAPDAREVIFTRGTTEGVNLVAGSWGRANVSAGDVIVLTEMEHHSNLVPWQVLAGGRGARLEFIPVTEEGRLDLGEYDRILAAEGERIKLVAVTHASNTLGTINPVREIALRAHAVGAVVLVDGAQSVPHGPVDVSELGCDFLAFSGHKMLGPMGAGVLYGKLPLLEAMPPFMGGGGMIRKVGLERSTWADVPARFEPGTPAVADAIGLGAAVEYLAALGMERVRAHEREITDYALARLAEVPGITIFGPEDAAHRAGVISFALGDVHPHDVAAILDGENVAVRAGHHCCQPLMRELGVVATTRASFYVYNTPEDADRLVAGLREVNRIFA